MGRGHTAQPSGGMVVRSLCITAVKVGSPRTTRHTSVCSQARTLLFTFLSSFRESILPRTAQRVMPMFAFKTTPSVYVFSDAQNPPVSFVIRSIYCTIHLLVHVAFCIPRVSARLARFLPCLIAAPSTYIYVRGITRTWLQVPTVFPAARRCLEAREAGGHAASAGQADPG